MAQWAVNAMTPAAVSGGHGMTSSSAMGQWAAARRGKMHSGESLFYFYFFLTLGFVCSKAMARWAVNATTTWWVAARCGMTCGGVMAMATQRAAVRWRHDTRQRPVA